jgi:hypothetical protein
MVFEKSNNYSNGCRFFIFDQKMGPDDRCMNKKAMPLLNGMALHPRCGIFLLLWATIVFRWLGAVIGTATGLSTLATCLCGPSWIVGEVAATGLSALAACFGSSLRIIGEIAATGLSALAARSGCKFPVLGKTSFCVWNASAAFRGYFALSALVHSGEAAKGFRIPLFGHVFLLAALLARGVNRLVACLVPAFECLPTSVFWGK